MGVIFDVPRIGTEKTKWSQKGPNCWYYSSKMMLKFHDKYKGAKESESDKLYQEWKVLHEIRVLLCSIEDQDKRNSSEFVKKALADKKKALEEYLAKQRSTNFDQPVKDFLKELDESKVDPSKAAMMKVRLQMAIDRADQIQDDLTERIQLLASFVPAAGFTQPKDDFFSSEKVLEERLRQWGPFYAGGEFAMVGKKQLGGKDPFAAVKDPAGKDLKVGKNIGKDNKVGDTVISVTEMEADSAHAIAIVGVFKGDIYYKDPNHSQVLGKYPFSYFQSKKDKVNVIGIWCEDGRASVDNDGMCDHMLAKQINL